MTGVADDGYPPQLRLGDDTPCGHDETSHLDLEIGAVALDDRLARLEAFRRDLV